MVSVDTPVVRSPEENGMLEWVRLQPKRARVTMLWTPALFPAGHRVFYDDGDMSSSLLKWLAGASTSEELARKFKQAGVSRMAINVPGGMNTKTGVWERSWPRNIRSKRMRIFGGFFRRYSRVVGSRGEALVYEIGDGGGAVLPEPFGDTGGRSAIPALAAAMEAVNAGRPDDAKAVLRALAPMAAESPYIAFRLGESWTALGEYGVALPLLERAIAAGYEVGVAYRAMALCLERLGRPAEARKAEKRAMELDPTDPEEAFQVSLMNEGFCR
jgi:hypothetical protein